MRHYCIVHNDPGGMSLKICFLAYDKTRDRKANDQGVILITGACFDGLRGRNGAYLAVRGAPDQRKFVRSNGVL